MGLLRFSPVQTGIQLVMGIVRQFGWNPGAISPEKSPRGKCRHLCCGCIIAPVQLASEIRAPDHGKTDGGCGRAERRFAETVADLGLMDADGVLVPDIDRQLAEIANGGDGYRAALARYALDLMVILDGADWSGYVTKGMDWGQAE